MDLPVVYIEQEPMKNMVWSAVEVFNRECLGFVFGRKPSKKYNSFVIENAVNIQMATRRNLEVKQSKTSSDRMDAIIDKYGGLYPFIGDFHSHPEWRTHKRLADLSEDDVKSMKEDKICLSIIIKISSINKDRPIWGNVSGGGIQGSLDRYKFHINAFTMLGDFSSQNSVMLEIRAPAAIKSLNRALGYK